MALLELREVMVQYSILIEEVDVELYLDSSLEKIASSSEVIVCTTVVFNLSLT